MVREFFASYTATVLGFLLDFLPKGKKPLTQPQLTYTKVRGVQVDILEATFCYMLFGLEY